MDGTHDLGGKEGFGPIPIDLDETPFHYDWESRMWAIARSGARGPGITIDWFRHGLECMVPSDYLSYRYFQKWCANYFMLLIDNGTFTPEEVKTGHTDRRGDRVPARTLEDVLQANRASQISFEVEVTTAPRFSVGHSVVTQRRRLSGHTRLPMYARGARGEIIAHHGAHLLPDKGARDVHEGEHLYTVCFPSQALWGEDANSRDSVALDLWENYLVPA
jgi:nitrile hydratase beta subunit